VGDLLLNENSHEVTRAGEPIHLTSTEFKLLRFLMDNPRQVLSKAQIMAHVWPHDLGDAGYNVVEIYVSYLRRKVDQGRTPMIHTVRGVGYVLKPAGGAIRQSAPPVAGSGDGGGSDTAARRPFPARAG
jgi:two-component system OmpR family response regulator